MMADDGWRCVTVDVPGTGATQICFSADQWAALSGRPGGDMPPQETWEPALMTKVRSWAAAASAALG